MHIFLSTEDYFKKENINYRKGKEQRSISSSPTSRQTAKGEGSSPQRYRTRQTSARVTWKRRKKMTWLVFYKMQWNVEPVPPGGQCQILHRDHADSARVQSGEFAMCRALCHSYKCWVSAGTVWCISADLNTFLLYHKLSSSVLEFCPLSLTANLIWACFLQFLRKGSPRRYR